MKKVFSVLLTSFAVFSLIACAGNKPHSVESKQPNENTTSIIINNSSNENKSSEPAKSSEPISSSNPISSNYTIPILTVYHVRFVNFDDSLLFEQYVEEGRNASYGGETPTKEEDDEFTYEFDGWDKELTNIRSDTTFIAQFKAVAKENWGPITWF